MSRVVSVRVLGAVTGLLFLAMAIHAAPLRPSIPAIQFTYSEAAFNAILAQWQADGVARFKAHFAFDFPFLVSYGLFGYLLFARLHTSSRIHPALGLPLRWSLPVAALADAMENLLHLHLVHAATAMPTGLYLAAGLVATCKWLLIGGFLVGAIYAKARRRVDA